MKRRRTIRRRNPMAAVVRRIKPKTEPSARAYRRHAKHKGRPEIHDRDGLFVGGPPFRCQPVIGGPS